LVILLQPVDRFSEDLDFTAEIVSLYKVIRDGLSGFYIDYEISESPHEDGNKITIRVKGPLFTGSRQSLCKIEVDLSFRERVLLKPNICSVERSLRELPVFDVIVMQEKDKY